MHDASNQRIASSDILHYQMTAHTMMISFVWLRSIMIRDLLPWNDSTIVPVLAFPPKPAQIISSFLHVLVFVFPVSIPGC
jgi:hypothetical protein